jgi:hypothetical protein
MPKKRRLRNFKEAETGDTAPRSLSKTQADEVTGGHKMNDDEIKDVLGKIQPEGFDWSETKITRL